MPEDKTYNRLEKFLSTFEKKNLTEDDFLGAFEKVVAYIKSTQDTTATNLEKVFARLNEMGQKIEADNSAFQSTGKKMVGDTIAQLRITIDNKLATLEARVNSKIADVKDGKDADEEAIVQTVLSQIPPPKEVLLDTPDEVVGKINKSGLLIARERVDGLLDAIRMASASAVASMPVTTNFFNGVRGKNLNIVGGTVTQTGDTVNVTVSGSGMTKPMTTGGDIIYGGASGTPTRLANGTAGQVLQSNGTTLAPSWVAAGAGDMILASAQTNSGIKTFLDTTMKLRNVANTFDGYFVNTNTADRIYTLQNRAGTLADDTDLALKANLISPTFATSITGSYLTASEMLITDASKNIVSAAVATYPSLTELTYLKGVTSAIQTQINAKGAGTVTTVGFTGGLITVANATTTPALTVAGTSGGIPYFSSASTWATSAALAANAIVIGGGAGATPATTTTGTGVLTALGVNVGSAGAFVTFNGALGTPSSGTVTNLTGTASININGTVGATTPGTGAFTTLSASSAITASTTIELGHATDTTLSRSAAGVLAVEGVNVLTVAGGTLTGSITLGENTSIALDPAGSADGKYTGITVTGTAGYTQAFGDLNYLAVADSRWELADADASATAGPVALAMVVVAGTDGNSCTLLLQGIIRADAKFPTMTVGATQYVGETAGEIQGAIPTGADNVIRTVGYALTADELYFNPSTDWQISVA